MTGVSSEFVGGLTHGHFQELNGLFGSAAVARYATFRGLYSNDPYALEQIDFFDNASPYGIALKLYKSTVLAEDSHGQEILEEWFAENYPLVETFGSTHTTDSR